jgi:lipoate-protein ligase A
LHTDEITYSVALLQEDPRAKGDIVDSYRRLSEGLLAGLDSLDAGAMQASRQTQPVDEQSPVCFETPSAYEIVVSGKKLVGSAQWRSKGGVLQHGSLPLTGDLSRIVSVLDLKGQDAERHRQDIQMRATTLESALGYLLSFEQVAAALANGFESALKISLAPSTLSRYEQSLVAELRDSYLSP